MSLSRYQNLSQPLSALTTGYTKIPRITANAAPKNLVTGVVVRGAALLVDVLVPAVDVAEEEETTIPPPGEAVDDVEVETKEVLEEFLFCTITPPPTTNGELELVVFSEADL